MLDLHVQHILINGFKYFKADRSLFDPLFTGVSDAYLAKMYNKLVETPIMFDNAYNVRSGKDLPLITIELNETKYDGQGLGMSSSADYTRGAVLGYSENRFVHEIHSQQVRVNFYATEMELLRVMHQIIKGSLLLFSRKLLSSAYDNFLYEGTNALKPIKELQIADLVVYGRQCVYSATQIMEIPYKIEDITNIGATEAILPIQVQSSEFSAGDLSSGVAGGVVIV